ncbi:hypothetical protein K0B96_15870 [Horticoccus luteus]|uniref:Uncharacterized protein n=1 Tax=Horticoccus luteus TaxID=2862869 RepID=A0A8F9XGZ3_9BACT|nr:hypothetical protein [Horticoccus luteus]QYM78760.1 hypothetical protein K0B96_15870 [Horticoccus luteus]
MKGWLGDLARTAGALWYWNARKSVFVLRGRKGQCPCHNPSDSGRPFETGCEGAAFWNDPQRFQRRVCPLLARNQRGEWVCSVSPAGVRPFWGRAAVYYGGATLGVVLVIGTAGWGAAHAVGLRASPRQILWPPAWHELRQVRAEYFVEKAETLLAQGHPQEAALSLTTAYEMNPDSYAIGMIVAQFYWTWRPDLVDGVYAHLVQTHPEHHDETTQVWLRSLLARGDLMGVAKLARQELARQDGDPSPWTHALIVASRLLEKPELLDDVARDPIPDAVKSVLTLEARTQRMPPDAARDLLFFGSTPSAFAYANFHRIDRLIELGAPTEALTLLEELRNTMKGRDVLRLVLAAHAVGHNRAALEREAQQLVAPERGAGATGVTVLALHLIAYPDPDLLTLCITAWRRLPRAPAEGRDDATEALYFAAILAGAKEDLPELRAALVDAKRSNPMSLNRVEELLRQRAVDWPVQAMLPLVQPMSLELNYALLEKYYALQQASERR